MPFVDLTVFIFYFYARFFRSAYYENEIKKQITPLDNV